MTRVFLAIGCVALVAGCATTPQRASLDELRKQVADTERAFARTMAERNFNAFTSFLADDAVFYAGQKPIRGKQAVADDWKRSTRSAKHRSRGSRRRSRCSSQECLHTARDR